MRVAKLTQDQIDRFPEFIEKWTWIGLCTAPADRATAEHGIQLSYQAAGLQPPKQIIWTTSPAAQGLARAITLATAKRTRQSVGESVWQSVRQSVGESVGQSVRESVWQSVWQSVGQSVWHSVRQSVGESVWQSVRQSVWQSVGQSVWHSVRQSVGESVRQSVGESVGQSVRESVWQSVWQSVGESVGQSVRQSVWQSVGESSYGQHDAAWLSFYDYFRLSCGFITQTDPLSGLNIIAQSAGWYLPHEQICWISERHHRVCRNSRGQLHSHDGMAVQYPDGWGVWAWNGVRVNEQIILRPETLTSEQIAKEVNAQVRQVMVERIGIERVCQMFNAKVIDKKDGYELLDLDLGDGRRRPYLKMINPSVKCYHIEGVHPECDTVQKALNWRNSLTPSQIDEVNGADWIQQGDVILKPKGAVTLKSQPNQLT